MPFLSSCASLCADPNEFVRAEGLVLDFRVSWKNERTFLQGDYSTVDLATASVDFWRFDEEHGCRQS